MSQKMVLPFVAACIIGLFSANISDRLNIIESGERANIVNSQPEPEPEIKLNLSDFPTFYIKGDECKANVRESDNFQNKKIESSFDVNIDSKSVNCVNYYSNSRKIISTSKSDLNNTNLKKQNIVRGTIILQVRFLTNGKISSISDYQYIHFPKGASGQYWDSEREQAISSARKVVFEPSATNRFPRFGGSYIQYNFTVYQ